MTLLIAPAGYRRTFPRNWSWTLVALAVGFTACQKNKASESTGDSTEENASAVKTDSDKTTTAAQSASAATSVAKSPGKVIYKGEEPKGNTVFEKLEAAGRLPPVNAKPVSKVSASPGDPEAGEFTLEEATAGLEGEGKLVADIVTELGTMSCELYEDKAPLTVANFVGLARGTRAWKKDGEWVKKPLYNGTTFHRVIKTFMIQGGDPNGNGTGGPGYVVPDEIWEGGRHSEPGLLCMANAGPDTNGSQFFILNNMALQLDGGYTIFGKCKEIDVVDKIASVPVRGDRAVKPPVIKKIDVKRVK